MKAPEIYFDHIMPALNYTREVLDNGIPVYSIHAGETDVTRLDIVIDAGRFKEKHKSVSYAVGRLLREGTRSFSAKQIAETLDFHGAELRSGASMDVIFITVSCLSRHLEKLMPLIAEMLSSPVFPEDEVASFVQNSLQRLKLELLKHDSVAYRILTEHIYGSHHPYGYNSTEATYRAMNQDMIVEHFRDHFLAGNAKVFISGKPVKDFYSILNRHLENALPQGKTPLPIIPVYPLESKYEQISLPNSVQASLRIGKRMFGQEHPDYVGFSVLNTLLGGYFGSRLMNNLREDKGITYGIYSSLDTMQKEGFFSISTDVDREGVKEAIHEILHEVRVFTEEMISEEELIKVKRYILGNMLALFDGPFSQAQTLKNIVINELPDNFFSVSADAIRQVSAEQLQALACTYLQSESFYTVVVD